MTKKYSVFITLLFVAFIGGFFALNLLTPAKAFSEQENRALAQKPELKAEDFALALPVEESGDFFTGQYMSDFETYVTDQFYGRDGWIAIKSASERALGKLENNGVYLCKNDTLIARFDDPDESRVTKNFGYVETFVANAGVPVYFSLIPGKTTVWADRLPEGAPNADEMDYITRGQAGSALWVDTYSALMAHKDEDIFYRTDHHWTSLGAYYAYAALVEAMGFEPVPLEEYTKTTVSTEFFGTTYSTSGVRWVKPDVMDTYVTDEGVSVTNYFDGTPTEGDLYDESYLEKKDKYSMFLSGNKPLCVIKSDKVDDDAPKLLIVRDSYSDSLAPFLTAHFSEVHLFDARYFKTSLPQYIAQNDIDMALVLYSVSNFVTDANFFVLGMG